MSTLAFGRIEGRLDSLEHWRDGNGKPGAAAKIDRLEERQTEQFNQLGCHSEQIDSLEKEGIATAKAVQRLVELAEETKNYRLARENRERDESWLKKNWLVSLIGLLFAAYAVVSPIIQAQSNQTNTESQAKALAQAIISELQVGGKK